MNYKVQINPPSQIVKRLGLDKGGKAQMFHTQNVLRRIQRYMPYREGFLIKRTIASTDIKKPVIVCVGPGVRVLFNGVSASGKPINYTKTKNPQAGARWDRRLSAAEGKIMAKELEAYVRRG